MPEGQEPPQGPPADDQQEEKPDKNVIPPDELARRQQERAEEEHAADETVDSLIRNLPGPRPSAEDLLRQLEQDPEIQRMQQEERERKAREAAGQPPFNVRPLRPTGTENTGEILPESPTQSQEPPPDGGSNGTPGNKA